jgi:hypothetical protein
VRKRLIVLLIALSLTLCYRYQASVAAEPTGQEQPATIELAPGGFTGRAVEAIKASRYTYVQVDTGREKIWAATIDFRGKVGDMVTVPPEGLPMKDFHSNTLNRDFAMVYFVGIILPAGHGEGLSKQPQMPPGHPAIAQKESVSQSEISGIVKAKNGKTVAEVYAAREDLAGKPILVRGRVVKFIPKVMGKNWVHLRDGSGSDGTNDLTVTTDAMVEVGDLVVVSGVVSVDRDFGYGYSYTVLLEDAEVTVE